jgi:hypothetical protein
VHYSNQVNSCRIDFFRQDGKWFATIAVKFTQEEYAMPPHDALRSALRREVSNHYLSLQAVCLEPYSKYSYPVSLVWEG